MVVDTKVASPVVVGAGGEVGTALIIVKLLCLVMRLAYTLLVICTT